MRNTSKVCVYQHAFTGQWLAYIAGHRLPEVYETKEQAYTQAHNLATTESEFRRYWKVYTSSRWLEVIAITFVLFYGMLQQNLTISRLLMFIALLAYMLPSISDWLFVHLTVITGKETTPFGTAPNMLYLDIRTRRIRNATVLGATVLLNFKNVTMALITITLLVLDFI
jgi:hypothetical protein